MPRSRTAAEASPGPAFWRFWLARTLSLMGDRMTMIAVVTASFTAGGGVAGASVVMLAFTVPRLLGPAGGAIADRLDARKLMPALDLGQAAVTGALLVFIGSQQITVVLVFLATLMSTVYLPSGRRSIATLARPGAARRAYAAIGTSWNASWACGPAIGGALIALGGVRLPLAVDVVTFVVSALLMRTLPAMPPSGPEHEAGLGWLAVYRTMRRGLAILVSSPIPRAIVINLFLVVAFGSVDTIALLALTERTFHTGAAGYSLLLSLFGIGMLGGSAIVSVMRRAAAVNVLTGGEVCFAVGTLATGLAAGQLAAIPAQLSAGLGHGVENVSRDILIQESMPHELLGTVTGAIIAVPYLGNLAAYSAAPALVGAVGARHALIVSAAGVLAAVLGLRAALARGRRKRASGSREAGAPGSGAAARSREDRSADEHHHDLDAVESS
jgi:MFS family permease